MENIDEDIAVMIEHSDNQSWAFTLRKTKLKIGPVQADYEDHMENLCSKLECVITDKCFEYQGGIHMHGIIQIPKGSNMKQFRVRGWRMHLVELYDKAGWQRYMAKEAILKDHEVDVSSIIRESLFKKP